MNDARQRGELPEDEWPETEDVFTSDTDGLEAADLELDEDVDEFADEAAARPAPTPAPAPVDAPGFFDANADLHALDDLTLAGRPSVLERLGPAHFRSKGFSFMGFLQTVYDHVAEQVNRDAAGVAAEQPGEPAAFPAAVESPAREPNPLESFPGVDGTVSPTPE